MFEMSCELGTDELQLFLHSKYIRAPPPASILSYKMPSFNSSDLTLC